MRLEFLYISGFSIPKVSNKVGLSRSAVRYWVKKKGMLREKGDGIRLAGILGNLSHNKGKTIEMSDEWKENIRKGKLRHGETHAKGTTKKPNGYIEVTRGVNKGRSEHVVIIENKIGRRLQKNECVHHINGIRHDNRIENLQLMTRSEHARLHAIENINQRERDEKGRLL